MVPVRFANADRAALEISTEELSASRWDYVALGHYHVCREIAPNAFYSGSIDYTSANTWGELHEERDAGLPGKGFIERDLASGMHTFHPLPAARALIDLPAISARGLTVAELDEKIRVVIGGCDGGIDDKIVRLLVRDVSRHLPRELDHKAIREYKRRALNFHLDFRSPETLRLHATGAPGRRPSLNEVVRDNLLVRPLDADIDRAMLVERALGYLDQAQAADVAPAAMRDT